VHELRVKVGSFFREDFRNGVGPRAGYVERPQPGCGLDLSNDRSGRESPVASPPTANEYTRPVAAPSTGQAM